MGEKMNKKFVNTLEAAETYTHTHTHTHTDSFLKSLKQIGTICFLLYMQSSVAATYNCEVVSNTSVRIGNEYMQLASKNNLLICGHKNAWQNTDKGCHDGQRVLVYKNYSFAGSNGWHQDAKIYKCNTENGTAWEHVGWPADANDCWAREYEGHNVDGWDHFIDVDGDKEVRCEHKYTQYDSDGNESYWCKSFCIRDKVKKSTTSNSGSGSTTSTSTTSNSGSGSTTSTSTTSSSGSGSTTSTSTTSSSSSGSTTSSTGAGTSVSTALKTLEERCKEYNGGQPCSDERLACYKKGAATIWESNRCKCKDSNKEWKYDDTNKTGDCVAKTSGNSSAQSNSSGSSTQTSTSQNGSLSEVAPDCSKIEEDAAYDSNHIRWKLYDESRSENAMREVGGFNENSRDLNAGEWAVTFSFGEVKGRSLCSDTAGVTDQYSVGKPNEQVKTGDYCWCKANGVNKWVSDGVRVDTCMTSCAMSCATYLGRIKEFRNLVFGCSEPVESKQPKEKGPENKVPVTAGQSLVVKPAQEDLAKKQEIDSAKNVLSGFFAAAESGANVWKNEEGKFNTARLASDLGAAVVLGTVGGVVSGTVIKKKQIKKGFESLQCYIGGRAMAGWGDTFNVDLAR